MKDGDRRTIWRIPNRLIMERFRAGDVLVGEEEESDW